MFCKACNEVPELCECERRRRPRYYDELACLAAMFRRGREWKGWAIEAAQPPKAPRFVNPYWGTTITQRAERGWQRLPDDLRSHAVRLLARGTLVLSKEAIYAIHFRERLHPEDESAVCEAISRAWCPMRPQRWPLAHCA